MVSADPEAFVADPRVLSADLIHWNSTLTTAVIRVQDDAEAFVCCKILSTPATEFRRELAALDHLAAARRDSEVASMAEVDTRFPSKLAAGVGASVPLPWTARWLRCGQAGLDVAAVLLTPYIRGVPLHRLVTALHPRVPPTPLVAGVAAQLLILLHRLHDLGVRHRDLKLPNVLLHGSTGAIHLIDFGSACLRPSASDASPCQQTFPADDAMPIGTRHVRSPEMYAPIGGHDATSSGVDVYALGVALYELAEGRPAFGCFDLDEAHPDAAVKRTLEALAWRACDAEAPLADLVRRLLNRDPDARLRWLRGGGDDPGAGEACPRAGWDLRAALAHPFFATAVAQKWKADARVRADARAKADMRRCRYPNASVECGPEPSRLEVVQVKAWTLSDWTEFTQHVMLTDPEVEDAVDAQLAGW